MSGGLRAQSEGEFPSLKRAITLFDHGRWADARHELLALQATLREEQTLDTELCAYYLAVCTVELGHPEAETALKRFEQEYPGSLRTNDVRFALACHYCTQGDCVAARASFDRTDYLTLNADNRTKYDIRRGYLEFVYGDHAAAYRYFQRVEKQGPYYDHACYYMAYIDYTQANYAKARLGFQKLCNSESYQAVAPFYLLQLEFREGNYTYVTQHGDSLIATASKSQQQELRRLMAESWFRLSDYSHALGYMEAYWQAGGEMGRDDSYLEGFSLYRLARYDEAAEALRRVAGADDALTQNAAYHLADCYLRRGEKEAAMQAFAMATNRNLNAAIAEDALYNYGKLQYELGGGRFGEAIHVLDRYLKEYPQSERCSEVNTLLAAAYYNSEAYDAAYEAIRQVPNPDSELRAARQKITYFRALKHYEQGDRTSAARLLKESASIGVSPRFGALASFWLGEIAFEAGNYTDAKAYYERYQKRAPRSEREYLFSLYNLGYCHLRLHQPETAESCFTRFLEAYPTEDAYRDDARNREGDCRYARRHFDEALKSYETAARAATSARYYAQYQRALTLGVLDRTEEKIEALRSIISVDSGDYTDEAAYELGRTYLSQNRYREAAQTLARFVEQHPHSPNHTAALGDLGLIYANLGDQERSLSYYEQVVKLAPTSSEGRSALQGIREIYVAQDNVEGYFAYAQKSGAEVDLSTRTRDSLSFAAAQGFYLQNRTQDASRSLRSYIKSFPRGAYLGDALYALSDCYRQLGNPREELHTLCLLDSLGSSLHTDQILERIGTLAHEQKAYSTSADVWQRLSESGATQKERQQALENYVEVSLEQGDRAAILAMAAHTAAHPDATSWALRKSRHAQASLLWKEGKRQEALALYEMLSHEVRTAEGGEAMYRRIEALFSEEKLSECEALIFRFAEMPSPHNYWLAKAYLLLGDLYRKQGDNFQARATYQSVADGYSPANDGIVAEAKQRIAQLN